MSKYIAVNSDFPLGKCLRYRSGSANFISALTSPLAVVCSAISSITPSETAVADTGAAGIFAAGGSGAGFDSTTSGFAETAATAGLVAGAGVSAVFGTTIGAVAATGFTETAATVGVAGAGVLVGVAATTGAASAGLAFATGAIGSV